MGSVRQRKAHARGTRRPNCGTRCTPWRLARIEPAASRQRESETAADYRFVIRDPATGGLRNRYGTPFDSVLSNIPEGFEQPTDRSFALYLYRSKASAAEVRARLLIAWRRHYIDPTEYARCSSLGIELGKMLAGFIKYLKYLRRCDRKDRGRSDRRADSDSDSHSDSDSDYDSD